MLAGVTVGICARTAAMTSSAWLGHRRYSTGLLVRARAATPSIVMFAYPVSTSSFHAASSNARSKALPRRRDGLLLAVRGTRDAAFPRRSGAAGEVVIDTLRILCSSSTVAIDTARIFHARAVAATQTSTDGGGPPGPRPALVLLPPAPAVEFGILMAGEARRRGAARIRQLVFPGDGAAWIWNLATQHFPEATQIVDLYHAREHLHDLARLLEFMLLDRQDEWLAARLEDLDRGDIDGICRAARA